MDQQIKSWKNKSTDQKNNKSTDQKKVKKIKKKLSTGYIGYID